jgi:hypothetical protein
MIETIAVKVPGSFAEKLNAEIWGLIVRSLPLRFTESPGSSSISKARCCCGSCCCGIADVEDCGPLLNDRHCRDRCAIIASKRIKYLLLNQNKKNLHIVIDFEPWSVKPHSAREYIHIQAQLIYEYEYKNDIHIHIYQQALWIII